MQASARTHPRVIFHVDMDAFYAAVEVRDHPELAGKPLIIGHRGPRGVVSTCSYEARPFGVRSAMPSVRAERLCPHATWLPGRMEVYSAVSREIRAIFHDTSPLVEPVSIDEAFLDMTGIAAELEHGGRLAAELKARIRREQHLTASVGVAPNKFLAKFASDLEKPDGLVVLPLAEVPDRLWVMPVDRLWGVGPKTSARLEAARIRTVLDLLKTPRQRLEQTVGASQAAHLVALARGEDDRPVTSSREPKSISEERTYETDLRDADVIDRALLARAEGVARELRGKGCRARTVHIKVRTGSFETWTRAQTLAEPTDLAEVIVEAARALLRQRIRLEGAGVRLLGVGVSHLEPTAAAQDSLFVDEEAERRRRLAGVADALRERLGHDALVRARLLRPERGGDAEDGRRRAGPPRDARAGVGGVGGVGGIGDGGAGADHRDTGRDAGRDDEDGGEPREASSLPAVD